jgi:hypothetical protein
MLASLLLLLAIGGCAGGGVIRPSYYLEYVEPTRDPAPAQQLVIDEPIDVAREQLLAGLGEGPLEVADVDPSGRFVIARYSGAPDPYVDCGTLFEVPKGPGPSVSRPKKASLASDTVIARGSEFTRSLRLDGRLVATLEEAGDGTVIRPTTTYVLSKIIEKEGSGEWGSETIAFPSGTRAAFARGTACQPTGRLEAAAFAAVERGAAAAAEARARIPAPEPKPETPQEQVALAAPVARIVIEPVAIETLAAPALPPSVPDPDLTARLALAVPEGSCGVISAERVGRDSVILDGVVSDLFTMDSVLNVIDFSYPNARIENGITLLSRGGCRAYRLVERERSGDLARARLQVVNLENGVLTQGDTVRLALGLPENRSHIHISYFRDNGTVTHYELETPFPIEPDVPWLIDTRQPIEPPFGRDFILAVATEQPLFSEPRPASEPASDFVPALEAALDGGANGRAMTACTILTTAERAVSADDEATTSPELCGPDLPS